MTMNTNTNTAALASRAACLLTKKTAVALVAKAIQQAVDAKRVHPVLAEDFGQQLGYDLPLKTRDFIRVVGHLLTATEKPLKGVVSRRKRLVLEILAELVGALTDTPTISLPTWAEPKAVLTAEESAHVGGSLEKANTLALALAEEKAAKAEAEQVSELAQAVALVVSRAAELSEAQRAMLLAALASEAVEVVAAE